MGKKGRKRGLKGGDVGIHAEKRVLKESKKGAKRRQKWGKKGTSTEQSMTQNCSINFS